MTFSLTIGGTDVAGRMVLPEGLGELTSAADGEENECQIIVDDPNGEMTFLALAEVIGEESAAANPRLYTGIVTQLQQSRGPYGDGPGRIWTLTITDLNERIHRRVFHAGDAKRPAETGTQRLDWLLGSVGLTDLVWDNGQVMANAWAYDETDYRDQYADDVLATIVDAAAAGRWTTFVYWDPTAPSGEEPSLFYGEVTTTTFDSTLAISNVLSEIDGSTVFGPTHGSEVTGEAAPIYDGVDVVGPFGRLYRQLTSTFTTFGIHRDAVYETIRNNNLTSASLHADSFLAHHAGQVDTITCRVTLPRDKVTLITAGMRLGVYFSHLAGYDDPSYTFTRVTRCTVRFTEGTNESYDLDLELSTRGIVQSGGASGGSNPGDFPHQLNCTPATLVQSATGVNGTGSGVLTVTLGATPTPGNVLVAYVTQHLSDIQHYTNPAGFTEHPDSPLPLPNAGTPGTADGMIAALYRLIQTGDSAAVSLGTIGGAVRLDLLEFGGGWQLDDTGSDTFFGIVSGTAQPCPIGSVTAAAVSLVTGIGAWSIGNPDDTGTVTVDRGTLHDYGKVDGAHSPMLGISYEAVTGPTTVAPVMTRHLFSGDNNGTAGLLFSFGCPDSAADTPPLTGQAFGPVLPLETPDGATFTFSLSAGYEFADASLRVFVDRLDQTGAVTSYDGAARTFTLAFAPVAGELVEAYGQGR